VVAAEFIYVYFSNIILLYYMCIYSFSHVNAFTLHAHTIYDLYMLHTYTRSSYTYTMYIKRQYSVLSPRRRTVAYSYTIDGIRNVTTTVVAGRELEYICIPIYLQSVAIIEWNAYTLVSHQH